MKAGQAKYAYFSSLTSTGLLLLSMGIFLFAPLANVSAFGPSDLLNWFFTPVDASEEKVESQTSQNMDLLQAATNTDPVIVKRGHIVMDDKALSSDVGPSGTIADIEAGEHQGNVSLYVARSGDTIPQIAKMFDVSVNTILWANDLKKNSILLPGQLLIVLPVDGIQYVVKNKGTVRGIANVLAKKYKVDADEIVAFNDLDLNANLSAGEILIIPGGQEEAASSASTENTVAPAKSGTRTPLPAYAGYYKNPLPTGARSQGLHYGLRGNGRNSVDIAATKGDTIYAAAGGTVSVSHFKTLSNPWFSGFGNYIIIDHPNGTKTLYAHMSAVYVAEGARLEQGQPIGEVGNTGKVFPAPTSRNPNAGSHLHFELIGAKNPF